MSLKALNDIVGGVLGSTKDAPPGAEELIDAIGRLGTSARTIAWVLGRYQPSRGALNLCIATMRASYEARPRSK